VGSGFDPDESVLDTPAHLPFQVLIMDDHEIVRKGVEAGFHEYQDTCVIGQANNCLDAVELVEQMRPDLVLIHLILDTLDGDADIFHHSGD
jgi:DNA-binding NarL/FixJ family response regulator